MSSSSSKVGKASAKLSGEDSDSGDSFELLSSDDELLDAVDALDGFDDDDSEPDLLDASPSPQVEIEDHQAASSSNSDQEQDFMVVQPQSSRVEVDDQRRPLCPVLALSLAEKVLEIQKVHRDYLFELPLETQELQIRDIIRKQTSDEVLLSSVRSVTSSCSRNTVSLLLQSERFREKLIDTSEEECHRSIEANFGSGVGFIKALKDTVSGITVLAFNPTETSDEDPHAELVHLVIGMRSRKNPEGCRFLVVSHPSSHTTHHSTPIDLQIDSSETEQVAAKNVEAILKEGGGKARMYILDRPIAPPVLEELESSSPKHVVLDEPAGSNTPAPVVVDLSENSPKQVVLDDSKPVDACGLDSSPVAVNINNQDPLIHDEGGDKAPPPYTEYPVHTPEALKGLDVAEEEVVGAEVNPIDKPREGKTLETTSSSESAIELSQPPQPEPTIQAPKSAQRQKPGRKKAADVSWMLSLQAQQVHTPEVPPPVADATTVTTPRPKARKVVPKVKTTKRDFTENRDEFNVQLYSQDKLALLFGNSSKTKDAAADAQKHVPDFNPPPSAYDDQAEIPVASGSNRSSVQVETTDAKLASRRRRGRPSEFQWQLDLVASTQTSSSSSKGGLSEQPKASSASSRSRPIEPWSPLNLRPDISPTTAPSSHQSHHVNHRDDRTGGAKDVKGKRRQTVYEDGSGSSTPTDRSYKNARNDFAWQLALAATTLRPSQGYLEEVEERKRQRNVELGLVPFDCLVCFETIEYEDGARMEDCEHAFCKECISGHVESKLEENQFPVVCPICLTDQKRVKRGFVSQEVVLALDISEKVQDKFMDLQVAQLSIKIECPGCLESMHIAREDYLAEEYITCPLPGCGTRFCRACRVSVDNFSSKPIHACKVDETLDKLMQENGWKFCPGCRTPVQKESGCNHMTCRAPGCTTFHRLGSHETPPSAQQHASFDSMAPQSPPSDPTPKTKTPLPPGMVMGPDGKPCKICTAFRNWKPGTTSNTEPDTAREKARVAKTATKKSASSMPPAAGAFAGFATAAAIGGQKPKNTTDSASPISNDTEADAVQPSGRPFEPPSDCPPDVEVLGRATWTFLHTAAAYYPDKPTPTQRVNMLMLLRSLPIVYPCKWCANDFGECMNRSPPDVSSREKLSLWLCQRHNEVNTKLGKEVFDCAKVDERWKDGPPDGRCD